MDVCTYVYNGHESQFTYKYYGAVIVCYYGLEIHMQKVIS